MSKPIISDLVNIIKLKFTDFPQVDVCIVLATYNPNINYFTQQIDSLLSQTYRNWICLVVDDNSSIQSQNSIKEILSRSSQFIYISQSTLLDSKSLKISVSTIEPIGIEKKNSVGSFKNFEFGLSLVPQKIKYVCLCDQDDVWEANKVELLREILLKSDNKFALVHSDLKNIDGNNNTIHNSCWQSEGRSVASISDVDSLIFRNVVTGCTTMFKRDLLDIALPFPDINNYSNLSRDHNFRKSNDSIKFSKIPFHHDQRLALCAISQGELNHCSEALVRYRQHGNNVVGAEQKTTLSGDFIKILNFKSFIDRTVLQINDRRLLLQLFRKQLELKLHLIDNNAFNTEESFEDAGGVNKSRKLNHKSDFSNGIFCRDSRVSNWFTVLGLFQILIKNVSNYKSARIGFGLLVGNLFSNFKK